MFGSGVFFSDRERNCVKLNERIRESERVCKCVLVCGGFRWCVGIFQVYLENIIVILCYVFVSINYHQQQVIN